MTDEEAAQLRERWRWTPERNLPSLSQSQADIAALLADRAALRAEVEQWRAIGQEFVDGTPTWEVVNDLPAPADKMWRCCYCAVTRPKGVLFQHASDCPVTQARALLGDD